MEEEIEGNSNDIEHIGSKRLTSILEMDLNRFLHKGQVFSVFDHWSMQIKQKLCEQLAISPLSVIDSKHIPQFNSSLNKTLRTM